MDEKNGGPLTALHVSKRGIFHFRIRILRVTLSSVLLGDSSTTIIYQSIDVSSWQRPLIFIFQDIQLSVGRQIRQASK